MANGIHEWHHSPHISRRITRVTPQKGPQGTWLTGGKWSLSSTIQVCLWTKGNRLPRHHRVSWNCFYGHKEARKHSRLATTKGHLRSQEILRLHRVLSTFCNRILRSGTTTTPTHKESHYLALGTRTNPSIQRVKDTHVLLTNLMTAKLQQTILHTDRHIEPWHRRHTLTGGRRTSQLHKRDNA